MTTIEDKFDPALFEGVKSSTILCLYELVTEYIVKLTWAGEYHGEGRYLEMKAVYEAELDRRDNTR